MKKQDFDFLKSELLKDPFLCEYEYIKMDNNTKVRLFYKDKVITILECGFAYLITWYCEGYISDVQANHITRICNLYNVRFNND